MSTPVDHPNSQITIEDLFRAMAKVGLTEVIPNRGALIHEDLRTQPPILLEGAMPDVDRRGRHQFWLGRPNAFLCNVRKATPKLLGDGTQEPQPTESLRRVIEEARANVFWPNDVPSEWNSTASVIYGLVHDHFSKFAESIDEEGKEPAVFALVQAHELVWSQDGVVNYHFDGVSEIESTIAPNQERVNGQRLVLPMDNRVVVKHPALKEMLLRQPNLFSHKFGGILSKAEWQGPNEVTSARGDLSKVDYVYSVSTSDSNSKFYFVRHQVHPRIADKNWRQKGDEFPIVSGLTPALVSEDRILDLHKMAMGEVGNSSDYVLLPRTAAAANSRTLVRESVAFRLPVIRFGRVFLGHEEAKSDRWYGIHEVLSFMISDIGRLVEISFHRDYLDGLFANNAFWKVWMRQNTGMWK